MITARIAKNKYDCEILLDGKPVELASAPEIQYEGKRRVLVLRIADFQLLPESQCPERGRFEQILQAAGNSSAVAALEPSCSMLRLNPRACSGCSQRPI